VRHEARRSALSGLAPSRIRTGLMTLAGEERKAAIPMGSAGGGGAQGGSLSDVGRAARWNGGDVRL